MNRRSLLKYSIAAAVAVVVAPISAIAAWNEKAFRSKGVDAALKELKATGATDSDKIKIKAPDIAENGAVVPITVSSDLENVEQISIMADKNESPLTSTFNFGKGTVAFVSTRIKMGKTANVIAVVKAGGKFYKAQKEVKVTIGGCGG
jgi:sulfur-oxidizing protein SoxY